MLELYKRTFICFELASNKDKSQSWCIINVKAVFGIHFDDRAQKMSFLLAHLEKMQITHNWLKSNLKQNSYTVKSRVEARVTIQKAKSLGVLQTKTCH